MESRACWLVLAALLVLALLWVGDEDYQQEQEAQAIYNHMVCAGMWPDYAKLKPDCKEGKENGNTRTQENPEG